MKQVKNVRKEDAVKIAYYLMAVDGNTDRCEKAMFKQVAEGFHVDDANTWIEAVYKTDEILDNTADVKIIYDNIISEVDKILSTPEEDILMHYNVSANLLIWNLMALAIKDMDFSENELNMINHVAKSLDVDSTVLAEMDNAIRALYAIEYEIKWLDERVQDKEESAKLLDKLNERLSIIRESMEFYICISSYNN